MLKPGEKPRSSLVPFRTDEQTERRIQAAAEQAALSRSAFVHREMVRALAGKFFNLNDVPKKK